MRDFKNQQTKQARFFATGKLTFYSTIILVTITYSCHGPQTKPVPVSSEKIAVSNKGVAIAYDDTKAGDTTLIFVHGWNINKSYWSNQVEFFAPKYRVIALDLPGFGQSGKNREQWTVPEFGRDISALLSQLDLARVILIGHSMSGAIVLEAAIKNPDRVIGIVGIDNFNGFGWSPSPQEKVDIENAYQALRTNYKATATEYANQSLFSPSTDSVVRKRVLNDFTSGDSVIATDCLQQSDLYSADDNLRKLNKTLYLVNSSFHNTDTAAFRKNGIKVKLLDVGLTGHYPMIEKPNEFNLLLSQAIQAIAATK